MRVLTNGQALDVAPEAPLPSEFLLFRAGLNATGKGVFLFDAIAANAVMADFARSGVDHMIDLEHSSLDDAARMHRADAADALGWYQIELRGDGSLWAVNTRWNPEGERRLRARTQRYISPAFVTQKLDDGTERVMSVANCALCARPATYDAPALVAASMRVLKAQEVARRICAANMITYSKKAVYMDPEQAKAALEALMNNDAEAAMSILQAMIVSAASGASMSSMPPADGEDPLEQNVDPVPPKPGEAPAPPAPADPAKKEASAALAALTRLSGHENVGEAVAYFTKLKADADAVLAQAVVLEESSRLALVADLVKLGAEIPATAWAGDPKDRKPAARLLSEPIAELRARVSALKAAKGEGPKRVDAPPTGASMTTLSADDQSIADKIKDPARKAKFIELRTKYTSKGTEK